MPRADCVAAMVPVSIFDMVAGVVSASVTSFIVIEGGADIPTGGCETVIAFLSGSCSTSSSSSSLLPSPPLLRSRSLPSIPLPLPTTAPLG